MIVAALVGSATPRIFTPPLRELTPENSWGFDIIWFAREKLRQPLTPWQEWFVIHAFELMPEGMAKQMYPDHPKLWAQEIPRFKTILLLIARQNGKTHVAKTIIKWALFRKRMRRILGAAQTKNDAKELWEEILEECQENPELRKRMRRPSFNNGNEALKSKWGAYKIAATDRRAGRGKTNNLLFMDELREHKTWEGYSALSSTTLSPVGALNLLASNAGDRRSVVLKSQRDKAIEAIESGNTADSTVFLAEWSTDPDRDIDDRVGWAQANPELGHGRMTERDLLAEREAKEDDEFRTENLCQWVDDLDRGEFVPIVPVDRFRELGVVDPVRLSYRVIAVDVAMDGESVDLVSAGLSATGVHLEAGPAIDGFDSEQVVAAIHQFCQNNEETVAAILMDPATPASVLDQGLRDLGHDPILLSGPEVSAAYREFKQAVADGRVTHDGDPRWEEALGVATEKVAASGKFPQVDRFSGRVGLLVAGSFALWGLPKFKPRMPQVEIKTDQKIVYGAAAGVLAPPAGRQLASSGARRPGQWE